MESIKQWSKWCRLLLQGTIIIMPIMSFMSWLGFNEGLTDPQGWALSYWIDLSFLSIPQAELSLGFRLGGFAIGCISLGLWIYGLILLIRLFKLYEKGQVFTRANTSCLKHFATCMLVLMIVGVFVRSAQITWISLINPVGERLLSIGFGTQEVKHILVALIAFVIAKVMDEACRLQEEHDQVI